MIKSQEIVDLEGTFGRQHLSLNLTTLLLTTLSCCSELYVRPVAIMWPRGWIELFVQGMRFWTDSWPSWNYERLGKSALRSALSRRKHPQEYIGRLCRHVRKGLSKNTRIATNRKSDDEVDYDTSIWNKLSRPIRRDLADECLQIHSNSKSNGDSTLYDESISAPHHSSCRKSLSD